jgi:hypothetical protein
MAQIVRRTQAARQHLLSHRRRTLAYAREPNSICEHCGQPEPSLGRPAAQLVSLLPRGCQAFDATLRLAIYHRRRVVTSRLRRSGLLDEDNLQPGFEVLGTVQPWIFDFGHRNASLTLVQSLALRTNPEEAMDRALLLQGRVEDVADAEHSRPLNIAVTDEINRDAPAFKYLDHHNVKIVPADDTTALKFLLHPELNLQ